MYRPWVLLFYFPLFSEYSFYYKLGTRNICLLSVAVIQAQFINTRQSRIRNYPLKGTLLTFYFNFELDFAWKILLMGHVKYKLTIL